MTHSRFTRLEDPGTDFPFYNGVPVAISSRQWLWVMSMVGAGFMMLMLPVHWPGGVFGAFIPAVLMPAIPLVAFASVANGHWTAIFGRVGIREVRLMFGFALLNIFVSMAIGAVVSALTPVTSNAFAVTLGEQDAVGRMALLAKTLPQLLGEEVITLLPFLAVLTWLTHSVGLGRKRAIVGAWLITAVVFGCIHLPTYNWNWVQCIVVIGSARLMLTLPWIMTKNIWVSTGAHVINDWVLFGMSLLGSELASRA